MPTVIEQLLSEVPIPSVIPVRQEFDRPRVDDVAKEVVEQLRRSGILKSVGVGARVALTAGSRGIANLCEIVAAAVGEIRATGALPFIVPAMGSHGGATAEGQRSMLEGLGITEPSVGAPIESSMEVVEIGRTADGLPVAIDRNAAAADAVLVLNRVKPHVAYRGRYESGLLKMMAIGLGKQRGAQTCHDLGFGRMAHHVESIARVVLESGRILGAVAILENAFHETARIEALPATEIPDREPVLLEEARRLMPRLFIDTIDVLVIDRIGKDISGTGFDTNVAGRYHTPYASGGPDVTRLVILDLTDVSHGNANGIGIADFTTDRLFRKMSFENTYPNSLTSTVPTSVKLPMVLPNDRLAIQAGIRTCNVADKRGVRLVRILDTQSVASIHVSESLAPDVHAHARMHITGAADPLRFDPHGALLR